MGVKMSTDDVEQKNPNLQELSEAQTRRRIDEQLRRVGREADTETLRYSKGTRLAKGRSIAIAEWPTDSEEGNRALESMPYDLLRDRDSLNLRAYQLKAIQEAEAAVMRGQENILLTMATGTGKTRTIRGLIYRFLKSGHFRRILFLVDRTSLGDQAMDVFKEVKLEDLMTWNGIYNICGKESLPEKGIKYMQTVVAFANTNGDRLIIGVE